MRLNLPDSAVSIVFTRLKVYTVLCTNPRLLIDNTANQISNSFVLIAYFPDRNHIEC
jgi:hypothetical protein